MNTLSKERIDQLLEIERKTNIDKERRQFYVRRRNIRNDLLAAKALASGITISTEVLNAALKKAGWDVNTKRKLS